MVMKEKYTHRKSSKLTPVLVGSAVGAGIAHLLAPRSGKELRKSLERFTAKTGKQVAGAINEGRDLYAEGRKAVEKAVETGRKTYDEGRERLSEFVYKKKERSLMVPIMVSGILGAGIAFLLAPKTGKAVREDLKRIAVDTRDKVDSLMEKGKTLATEGIPGALDAVSKAYSEEKKKVWHAA
jgi:gas vesicle protein